MLDMQLYNLSRAGLFLGLLLIAFLCFPMGTAAAVPAFSYSLPQQGQDTETDRFRTVVGIPEVHTTQSGDTLLDVAREYGLGYLELRRLYPDLDPWLPPSGQELTLPLQWVLPPKGEADIVINLPELRLYHFSSQNGISLVRSYPVGIGDKHSQSPLGEFPVGVKREDPYWYIPQSLQDKYEAQVMDPGPKNPLGKYWIGLGNSSYGLHGTNNPWSVGRLATNGCIRLYPEHIQPLYQDVSPGEKVQLIYEPVKLGVLLGRIYVEAHPDIYEQLEDYLDFAYRKLLDSGYSRQVDLKKFRRVLQERNGLPVDVSRE
ncbi:MAG: L,D-transpeptidase family protein [Thermodesulfobacteriota bacterium]